MDHNWKNLLPIWHFVLFKIITFLLILKAQLMIKLNLGYILFNKIHTTCCFKLQNLYCIGHKITKGLVCYFNLRIYHRESLGIVIFYLLLPLLFNLTLNQDIGFLFCKKIHRISSVLGFLLMAFGKLQQLMDVFR